MEQDLLNEGFILYSQRGNIYTIDMNSTIFELHTNQNDNDITSFVQMPHYPKDILAVNKKCNQIIKFNRSTNHVETISTICNGEAKSVDGSKTNCSFNQPHSIVCNHMDHGNLTTYISEPDAGNIRTMSFQSTDVIEIGTLVHSTGSNLLELAMHPFDKTLYLLGSSGIHIVELNQEHPALRLVIDNKEQRFSDQNRPTDITFLSYTHILISYLRVIQLVDIESKAVTDICHLMKSPQSCVLPSIQRLLVANSSRVFIGYKDGIAFLDGAFQY